jgi:putative hydrolase of the HAD superfamily
MAWLVELDAHGCSSRRELVASVAEPFGVWPDQAHALAQFRHDLDMAVPEISREARRSLICLRRSGWKIAIVTDGTEPQQMLKIRVAGWEPLVDACVVSEAGWLEFGGQTPTAGT